MGAEQIVFLHGLCGLLAGAVFFYAVFSIISS